ncbi:MAG: hypothetical protein ACYCQJ_13205 [Nitrososphaerales archaeon]
MGRAVLAFGIVLEVSGEAEALLLEDTLDEDTFSAYYEQRNSPRTMFVCYRSKSFTVEARDGQYQQVNRNLLLSEQEKIRLATILGVDKKMIALYLYGYEI